MSLAIFDVEMILHRAIAASEKEIEWAPDEWTYTVRLGDAKAQILDELNAARATVPTHTPALALGDSYSFRYFVWPGYKSSRKKVRKPAGFGALRKWLEAAADTHGFGVLQAPQVEADDVIGLYAGPGDVIVSGDKDLRTVPGLHLIDGEVVEILPPEADLAFLTQTLTGDTSDGYPGCPGCGDTGAAKALKGIDPDNFRAMWEAVLEAYKKAGKSETDALIQARCARILRQGEYDWDRGIPKLWTPPLPSRCAAVE